MNKHSIHLAFILRLLSFVTHPSNSCLLWKHSKDKDGYGYLWINGKSWRVARVIAHVFHGLVLEDSRQLACHTCDEPQCCNPDHIFVGSPQENTVDAVKKFRWNPPRKLNATDIKKIAALYSDGVKIIEISRIFKVTRETVTSILGGRHKLGVQLGILKRTGPSKKPVICLNTGQEFPSVRAAAIFIGVDESNVSRACTGALKTIRGLRFSFK